LFLTDHGRRNWKNPDTGRKRFTFLALQQYLSDIGTKMKNNTNGNIRVSIFGITAKK